METMTQLIQERWDAYMRHCVAGVTGSGKSKESAFAICKAGGNKAGYYEPGTKTVTAKGKKAMRKHGRDVGAKGKDAAYERAIKSEETIMSMRKMIELLEEKAADIGIGFSWNSTQGVRKIVGEYPGDKWAVSTDGTTTHELIPKSEISRDITRDEQRYANVQRAKTDANSDALAKAKAEDTDGFVESLPQVQRGKALAALLQFVSFNGKGMSRRDYVRQTVKSGAVITGSGASRRLVREDGAFLDQKQLTKYAMDYADFLIRKHG